MKKLFYIAFLVFALITGCTSNTTKYSLNFMVGGGTLDDKSISIWLVTKNEEVTLPGATRVGYAFEGWYDSLEGSGIKLPDTITITDNTTIYAKWIIRIYTVTFVDDKGVVLKTEQVPYKGSATAPELEQRDGYCGVWSEDFNVVKSDLTVKTHYEYTNGVQFTKYPDRNEYFVSGYIGRDQVVTVPSTFNNTPVRYLREMNLKENYFVQKVIISEGIEEIGSDAFLESLSLGTIIFPSTLKRIGHAAFYDCTFLTRPDFPDGLTNIEAYAFFRCPISVVFIPKSVEYIGYNSLSEVRTVYFEALEEPPLSQVGSPYVAVRVIYGASRDDVK